MVDIEKGLEGVVIDESRLSKIDGERGDLWYAGYHIDELAERSTFPETLYLLINGRLPDENELARLESTLAEKRSLPPGVLATIEEMADRVGPMETLRTAVSMLPGYVDDPTNVDERLTDHLYEIIAKAPTIVAATHRYREGHEPVDPRDDLGHAANFLNMFSGEEPAEVRARALDRAMILYAEHGMNASTFASIVTASTRAHAYAAITSAIGTLQGPLHGGATETVVEALDDIGDPDNVEDWVAERLAHDERIPGFGHRVYRTTDPRCRHFREAIEAMGPSGDVQRWFATANVLREEVAEHLGEHGIWPNTDLYSGIFYRTMGIPPAFNTTIFTMGRVAGWSAHIVEQLADNRLLRPRVHYVGETGLAYEPIEER